MILNLCARLAQLAIATLALFAAIPRICLSHSCRVLTDFITLKLIYLLLALLLTSLLSYQWFREMLQWGKITAQEKSLNLLRSVIQN
jgi:hypothetical protein